jgi:hypothetical protein
MVAFSPGVFWNGSVSTACITEAIGGILGIHARMCRSASVEVTVPCDPYILAMARLRSVAYLYSSH